MGQEMAVQHPGEVALPRLSMPRGIAAALADNAFSLSEWMASTAIARISDDDRKRLPSLAEQAESTLIPVRPDWLEKRLSTMYLAMSHERDADRATAWLHESVRLLRDLPHDIVGNAIDEAVKKSDRGFMPSVGAIRAFADPALDERKKKVARLRSLAGAALAPRLPPQEPEAFEHCSPEDAAEILKEFGFAPMGQRAGRTFDPAKLRGPKSITVEDYVALGLTRDAAEAAIADMQRSRS